MFGRTKRARSSDGRESSGSVNLVTMAPIAVDEIRFEAFRRRALRGRPA
jgi:hypothetical protein